MTSASGSTRTAPATDAASIGASKSTISAEVRARPLATAGPRALAASGACVAGGAPTVPGGNADGRHEHEPADPERQRHARRRAAAKRQRQVDGGEDGQRENGGYRAANRQRGSSSTTGRSDRARPIGWDRSGPTLPPARNPRQTGGGPRGRSGREDEHVAREPGQALHARPGRRRGGRDPRSARRCDRRGRPRAPRRRPSGSAAARRRRPARGSGARASRARSRGPSRARSARPWPAASITSRAAASAVDAAGQRSTGRDRTLQQRDRRGLRARDQLVHREVPSRSARRRTASASCRSGTRPPAPRSRRGAPGRPARDARRASRAAAPPRARPARRRRTRGPPRRPRASASPGATPAPPRSCPGRIPGRSAASARSATAAAAAIRSTSDGSFMARSSSIQVVPAGTSSTSGAAAASASHSPCDTSPAGAATRRAPSGGEQRGPARGQVVGDVLDPGAGRLAPRLERVARVGQHHDLVGRDQEATGMAGDLLLAVAEDHPGQVADLLAAEPEVGVEAGLGEAGAQPGEARRARGAVGLLPGAPGGARRAAGRSPTAPAAPLTGGESPGTARWRRADHLR